MRTTPRAWSRQTWPSGALAAISALAAALRGYVAFGAGMSWYHTDTTTYFAMAAAILAGRPFSSFPNGFPLLIAAAELLLPRSLVPAALIGLNVLLATLIVPLVYGITRQLGGGSRTALLAAAIVALLPNQINYTRQLLTEIPTAFLLTLGFWLLQRRPLLAGIALFGAALFRSTLLPLLPLLWSCALALPNLRQQRPDRALAGFGAAALLYGALLLSGIVRPAANLGVNLLIAIHSYSPAIDFSLREYGQAELAHPLRTYLGYALTHPLDFARQRWLAAWELWGPLPQAGSGARGLAARLLIGVRFPLLVAAIGGGWLKRRSLTAIAITLAAAIITCVHISFFATPRFTLVVEPGLAALAAIALARGAQRIAARLARPASAPAGQAAIAQLTSRSGATVGAQRSRDNR